jgi:hypothetical protein
MEVVGAAAVLIIASPPAAHAPAAGANVIITVTGDGFVAGSIVRWNGVDLLQGFVDLYGSHTLTGEVSAALAATPGTYRVTVFNPGLNAGKSNAVQFTLTPP